MIVVSLLLCSICHSCLQLGIRVTCGHWSLLSDCSVRQLLLGISHNQELLGLEVWHRLPVPLKRTQRSGDLHFTLCSGC